MCKIVRRFLILVHKCQFPGYGWHPWILIPPIIFTNFSWAKSHNFFIVQKSKFTEIYNICTNWLLLQSIKGTCFQQKLNILVNFDFRIMKKIWKIGEYIRWALCWDQYSWGWVSAIPWKLLFMCWNQQTAHYSTQHCTEVHLNSFLSGGFITAIVVNPPERKLEKRISVHCSTYLKVLTVKCWPCFDSSWVKLRKTLVMSSVSPTLIGQYWWHLIVPFSIILFNISTALHLRCHTAIQKWPTVDGKGPWAKMYFRLALGT